MSTHISHPDDHLNANDDAGTQSSPVPEKWIPWVIVALATGLIFVGFAIPAGTFLAR
ncbi:MAG: hypothetical protein ACKVQT_15170 [Burkholderiales bacterium]